MPLALDNKHLDFDVIIRITNKNNPLKREALLTHKLVRFLEVVEEKGSVNAAAAAINSSCRNAQRMVKDFQDTTGIKLLTHHGPRGTALTHDARRCIVLYNACLSGTVRVANFDMNRANRNGTRPMRV